MNVTLTVGVGIYLLLTVGPVGIAFLGNRREGEWIVAMSNWFAVGALTSYFHAGGSRMLDKFVPAVLFWTTVDAVGAAVLLGLCVRRFDDWIGRMPDHVSS
jgi:hypothetical protein